MILSWGGCTIKVTEIVSSGTGTSYTFSNVVEGSASLNTTQGNKTEAKIEGGEIEAVKYDKNTYELTWQERLGSGKTSPTITNADGLVDGEFKVELTPEITGNVKFTINRASLNVQVSYNSADGAIATYTASALKPASGNTITWAENAG